jgi:hypothetical protein
MIIIHVNFSFPAGFSHNNFSNKKMATAKPRCREVFHSRQCSTEGWPLVSINSGGLRPQQGVAQKNKATN